MRQLSASAGRLAVDLDHPVYDCFYLALAVQEQYPVVTADRRFHDAVRAHPYLADRILHVQDLG
jgi:predicted nucleic acid-binding protein